MVPREFLLRSHTLNGTRNTLESFRHCPLSCSMPLAAIRSCSTGKTPGLEGLGVVPHSRAHACLHVQEPPGFAGARICCTCGPRSCRPQLSEQHTTSLSAQTPGRGRSVATIMCTSQSRCQRETVARRVVESLRCSKALEINAPVESKRPRRPVALHPATGVHRTTSHVIQPLVANRVAPSCTGSELATEWL